MNRCEVTERELLAWYDGLPGARPDIAAHAERCADCTARVAVWRRAGEELRGAVDGALGEVEPLVALQAIRARITQAEAGSLAARLRAWWHDLWTFNRRAVAGVVTAAALGALTAPALVYWMAERGSAAESAHVASVVIEELEFAGDAKAVVYNPEHGNTTIIWVEPAGDAAN